MFFFGLHSRYRIAAPKLFFDFSPFADNMLCAFKTKNGEVYLSNSTPILNDRSWIQENSTITYKINSKIYSSSVTNPHDPSIPWQKSLIAREGVERGVSCRISHHPSREGSERC